MDRDDLPYNPPLSPIILSSIHEVADPQTINFIPSRLEEHRPTWYFEDPIDRDVIIDLEKILGYTREDGKTWMEYFWSMTDGEHLAVKVKDSGLSCIDMTDPKNPKQLVDPGNPGQILLETDPEVFIERVSEYVKSRQ